MSYLLDTNVISELVARQPNQRVIDWIDALDPHDVYLSVVTIGELAKGIERLPASSRKEVLLDWLDSDLPLRFSGRILAVDTATMRLWGALTARLERVGRPLPVIDSIIAALALQHGLVLATRNGSDFRDTGVTVVDPWQE
jgi:toxin FitB